MTGSWIAATPGAPAWRKSTFSTEDGACVELAPLPDGDVALRNSRFPALEITVFTKREIEAFFQGVKAGEFDDLIS